MHFNLVGTSPWHVRCKSQGYRGHISETFKLAPAKGLLNGHTAADDPGLPIRKQPEAARSFKLNESTWVPTPMPDSDSRSALLLICGYQTMV